MTSSPDILPFNPFLIEPDGELRDSEGITSVEIVSDEVPYSADGFEELARVVDWSPSEIQVLRDAAAFIRWSAKLNKLPESEVIRNRLNRQYGITLVVRSEGKVVD